MIKDLGDRWYEMHTLIHQYLRDKLEESNIAINAKESYCQLMTKIAQQIPDTPTRDEIENFTPTILHLRVAARELNQWIADDDLVWVYVGLARFYQGQGIYLEAEPWYQQCLSITEERLGQEHPDVATSLNNLAGLYRAQGRYTEAEPLYQQAIAIATNTLGENHPNTKIFIQNYQQMIFNFLMQLPEAELKERFPPEIYEKILRIKRQ